MIDKDEKEPVVENFPNSEEETDAPQISSQEVEADLPGTADEQPDPAEEAIKFRDIALRAQAELENFRKRMAREREESVRYANASLVERLLPILDSFDLGLEAAKGADGAAAVVSGFEMVRKQLDEFLSNSGVEKIDAVGQDFDPNIHDAMGSEESTEVPEGKIIRQLRAGYKLRDRLLRPASVFVSKGSAPQA